MATEPRGGQPGPVVGGLRRVAVGGTAGLATGALIGGVGGRIAMLILRLTSDPSLHGVESDDGFTIGVVSSETAFLVMVAAALGAIGGVLYVVVRMWFPSGRGPWPFAALTGLVGGSLVIHPDGIDFTRLEPSWLAIVLFVLLPTTYGLAVATLAERWLREADPTSNAWLVALVPVVLPFALLGPRGLPFLVLILVAAVSADPRSAAGSVLSSRLVVWLGRTILAAGGIAATAALVADVAEIL
jgi:hypothetical protein